MLKVLYVTSEAEPFVSPSELAEAGEHLPQKLRQQGIDVRVVMPKYRSIKSVYRKNMRHLYSGEVDIAWRKKYLGVQQYDYQKVPYYFIDNRDYFYRDNYYGYNDDVERFTFFCRSVLEMLPKIDFWPDIIHLNDWQSALVSVYLKLEYNKSLDERYQKIKTLFTIHDLQSQGRFWKGYLSDVLALDWKYFNNGDLEFYDDINLMKGALIYADKIVNLSHPHLGKGVEGILQKRALDMCDIIEGIDYAEFNPETDNCLPCNFNAQGVLARRADNKAYLQKKLKLTLNRSIPMIGIICPLTKENGIELISKVMDRLLEYEEVQLVVVGKGDKRYENWLKQLVWCYPKKASVHITDGSETLELIHQIYAAADILLIAAQYKPYAKQQYVALRYGAVPLVYTNSKIVKNFDKYTQTGNGFIFHEYNTPDLLFTLKYALSSLSELTMHVHLINNGMSEDFSWQHSANQYANLYNELKNYTK